MALLWSLGCLVLRHGEVESLHARRRHHSPTEMFDVFVGGVVSQGLNTTTRDKKMSQSRIMGEEASARTTMTVGDKAISSDLDDEVRVEGPNRDKKYTIVPATVEHENSIFGSRVVLPHDTLDSAVSRSEIILDLSVALKKEEKTKIRQILNNSLSKGHAASESSLRQALTKAVHCQPEWQDAGLDAGYISGCLEESLSLATKYGLTLDQLSTLLGKFIAYELPLLSQEENVGVIGVIESLKGLARLIQLDTRDVSTIRTRGRTLESVLDEVHEDCVALLDGHLPKPLRIPFVTILAKTRFLTLPSRRIARNIADALVRRHGSAKIVSWDEFKEIAFYFAAGISAKLGTVKGTKELRRHGQSHWTRDAVRVKSIPILDLVNTLALLEKNPDMSKVVFGRAVGSVSSVYHEGVTAENLLLVQNYLECVLAEAEASRLSVEQTRLLLLLHLQKGLKQICHIMSSHGLALKYMVKFLLSLNVPETKMREIQRSFERYQPSRSKDAEVVLGEIKEIVLQLLSDAIVKEIPKNESMAMKMDLFLAKVGTLLPSSYVESLRSYGYSIDQIIQLILRKKDMIDAFFQLGNFRHKDVADAEVKEMVKLQIGSEGDKKEDNSTNVNEEDVSGTSEITGDSDRDVEVIMSYESPEVKDEEEYYYEEDYDDDEFDEKSDHSEQESLEREDLVNDATDKLDYSDEYDFREVQNVLGNLEGTGQSYVFTDQGHNWGKNKNPKENGQRKVPKVLALPTSVAYIDPQNYMTSDDSKDDADDEDDYYYDDYYMHRKEEEGHAANTDPEMSQELSGNRLGKKRLMQDRDRNYDLEPIAEEMSHSSEESYKFDKIYADLLDEGLLLVD